MLGETVSHYRIDSTIGEGGMGVVYAATDLRLRRQVAIKFCGSRSDTEKDAKNLLAEARAASKLNHPNIAQIYDCDETPDGRPFVVMEFVRGRSLADLLTERKLEVTEAVRLVRDVASALEEAHANGIVHRDIKPSNICVTDLGRVKVLDFGIAKVVNPITGDTENAPTHTAIHQTIEGTLKGTPSYMSPEQALGRPVDRRSDLFSLGCVFYECLTGKRPFQGDSLLQTLSHVIATDAPAPSTLNPEVPRYLDGILEKLLHKDQDKRYQTAHELIDDINAQRPRSNPQTLSETARIVIQSANEPKAMLAITPLRIGVAFLAIAAGAVAYYIANRPYEPEPPAQRAYAEGLSALRDGMFVTAKTRLQQAVDLDPNFAVARARLAEAWFELDYGGVANREMLKVRQSSSIVRRMRKEERLTVEAIENLLTFKRKEAIEQYRELVSMHDGLDRASALVDLGRAQDADSDYNAAIASFENALKIDPKSAAAWLRLGQLQRRVGSEREAVQSFTRAAALYHESVKPEGQNEAEFYLALLGPAEQRERRLEDLYATVERMATPQLQIRLLIQRSNFAVARGDFARADGYAKEAVKIAESIRVEVLAARALISMGQRYIGTKGPEGLGLFTQALRIAQTYQALLTEARANLALANYHLSHGMARTALDEASRAETYFSQAKLPLDELDADVLRARAFRTLGRIDESEKVSKAILARPEAEPGHKARAHESLAHCYRLRSAYRAAVGEYMQAIALPTGDRLAKPYFIAGISEALRAIGDLTESDTRLDESRRLGESLQSPAIVDDARTHRAEAELAKGNPKAALSIAEPLLAATGRDDDARADRVLRSQIVALALARLGMSGRAATLCEQILVEAARLEDAFSLPESQLACAEVNLLARRTAEASSLARESATFFQQQKMPDQHWRALALLASLGEPDAARQAHEVRSRMLGTWTSEDGKSYLSRPDIRLFSAYIGSDEKR